jgi:hypothetical protein
MPERSGNHPFLLNVITTRRRFLVATAGVAAAASLPIRTLAVKAMESYKIQNK